MIKQQSARFRLGDVVRAHSDNILRKKAPAVVSDSFFSRHVNKYSVGRNRQTITKCVQKKNNR